jgi:type III pantothenate kinase
LYITLDIGNTRVKFCTFNESGEVQDWGYLNSPQDVGFHHDHTQALCYCNVGHDRVPDFGGYTGATLELAEGIMLPIENQYTTPHTQGSDRIAAVAGAQFRYPGENILIVDAGTCLKFEALTKDKVYLGGSISPGLSMRYKALHQNTGRLPEVDHKEYFEAWGSSTEDCILSGVQRGFIAEVNGRIQEFGEKLGEMRTVICGGDLPFLANQLKSPIFAEPLLIHYGLYNCLRFNGF